MFGVKPNHFTLILWANLVERKRKSKRGVNLKVYPSLLYQNHPNTNKMKNMTI